MKENIWEGVNTNTTTYQNTQEKIENAVRPRKQIDGEIYTTGVDLNLEKVARINETRGSMFFDNLTWLTSSEAAEYLRLPSVGALRVLVCKRRIPFHKLGRSLRFKKSELDRLLDRSRSGGI